MMPTGRETLRGLPGVEVIVEDVPEELSRAGMTQAAVTATVTEQLRAAGITLYSSQRQNPSPAQPYLYIHLNAVSTGAGTVAVAVQVHVRQTLASLTSTSRVVNAMTWDAHDIVVAPSTLTGVPGVVADLVARFVADWKAVH